MEMVVILAHAVHRLRNGMGVLGVLVGTRRFAGRLGGRRWSVNPVCRVYGQLMRLSR